MESDITQLTKRMRDRRAAGGTPYVLLLGSGLSLTPAVRRAVCGDDDWETFWTAVEKMSPAERRAAFKGPLERLLLAEGYRALTRLLAAGYFEVVFTLNVDDTLDDTLRTLKTDEYRIWVYGEVTSAELVAALEYRNPRVKVLKLRGDVNAHKLPLTPEGQFEFPRELENAVTQWLSRDTMVVGDLPFDDDVWRCLRGGDGALWVVGFETSEVLRHVKQVRQQGGVITVESFNAFFTALADALEVEEVEPAWELPPQNPYQGLQAFTQDKARFFFGRERLTEKLLERLRRERFLAVVGASGSGKSSVVQAGLLHRLDQGALPDSADWPKLVCRPGELVDALAWLLRGTEGISADERQDLLARLPADETAIHAIAERVLQDAPPDHRLMLVVDQFEELFTLESAEYREQIMAALLYTVRVAGGRTTVVVTMRSDFYARVAEYDELFVWMEQHRVFVPPMGETGLRDAIQLPARLVKFPLDEALTETILADVGREPGALPLLQYALKELYDRWQEGLTPSKAYGEIGGVQGALEHRADEMYQGLSDRQQAVARHILVHLTQLGEGTEDTRRRATFEDLVTLTITLAEIEEVIDILAAAQTRLVVTDDPDKERPGQTRVVEVAHEALIRGWKRLQDWLNEDRAGLLLRQRLGERARQWEAVGGRHAAFDQAEVERDRAEQRARRARSDQLAAQSQLASERWKNRTGNLPLILAREAVLTTWAVDGYVTTEADAALRQAVDAVSPWCLTLPRHRHTDVVSSAAFSPDGKMIVTASWDRTARLWDVETGEQICLLAGHTAWINSAAFSPDGKTVATASGDAARLWDVSAALNTGVETGTEICILKGHTNMVLSVAFSPDGKTVVTASRDRTARLWDVSAALNTGVKTGTVIRILKGHTGPVLSAAFSPDGKTVVTASGDAVRLWNVETGAVIHILKGHTGWIRSAAFSPDGKTIVTVSGNAVWLWDVETGAVICTLKSQMDVVWSAAFSPDGKTIVTASGRTARLWDVSAALNTGVETGAEICTLKGHTDMVLSAAFSPDGKAIVTASGDRSARLWDVSAALNTDVKTGTIIRTFAGHTDSVWSAAFSPDGKTIVTASDDRTARLWDVSAALNTGVETGTEICILKGHTGPVLSAAFSPDGKTVVTTSWDQTARLWDVSAALNTGVKTGTVICTLKGHTAGVNSGAFSPDGKTIVTASDDHTVRLWDVSAALNTGVETGVEICTLEGHTAGVWSAAFGPDGKTIVTAGQDQTVRLWDVSAALNTGVETGAEICTLKDHAVWVNSAAFSPDGKTIVTANDDNTVRLWDVSAALNTGVETGTEIRTLAGHTDRVNSAAFSPDGKTIVTASGDKTVRLWDVSAALNTGGETEAIIRTLEGHTEGVNSAAFSPDGKTIVTASWDKTIRLWPGIEDLLALAESLIQREPPILTPEERRRFGLEQRAEHD